MSKKKMKPCPFCGIDVEVLEWPRDYVVKKRKYLYTVGGQHKKRCPMYACITPSYVEKRGAIIGWNRRKS